MQELVACTLLYTTSLSPSQGTCQAVSMSIHAVVINFQLVAYILLYYFFVRTDPRLFFVCLHSIFSLRFCRKRRQLKGL